MDDTPPQPPPQTGSPPPMMPPRQVPAIMAPFPPGSCSAEERQLGMWCHLASFAGYLVPIGNVLGPLILWLTKRETMPFVDREGKESVNFQISVTIYMVVLLLMTFVVCLTFPLLLALAVFDIVYVILASVEASKGNSFRYPLCIRFID